MRAFVLAEIPDANAPRTIAGDELALVRVDDDVGDGAAVVIVALHGAGARVPDLDGAVLGAGDHPFALAVERDAGHVSGMPVEREHGAWIVGADVVELDILRSGGGKVLFIGGDAQAVHLRVRVCDCARADS